jgi:DNA integrity scanning protein DisA with diadenylate cyclase activity
MQIEELKGAVTSKNMQVTQQASEIERLKADIEFQDGELSSLKDAVAAQIDELVCDLSTVSMIWVEGCFVHSRSKGCSPTYVSLQQTVFAVVGSFL